VFHTAAWEAKSNNSKQGQTKFKSNLTYLPKTGYPIHHDKVPPPLVHFCMRWQKRLVPTIIVSWRNHRFTHLYKIRRPNKAWNNWGRKKSIQHPVTMKIERHAII
jgi:hypothetical protein